MLHARCGETAPTAPPTVQTTAAGRADNSSDQRTTRSGAMTPGAGVKGAVRTRSRPGRASRSSVARRRRKSPILSRS